MLFTDKEQCCGCGVCEVICPRNCIQMKPDAEGFLYPCIDYEKCVHCSLCESVCPILNKKENEVIKGKKAYVVQNRDEKILRESTSGGAFTAIAEWTISKGGVVCGATISDDLVVRHEIVDNVAELYKFRNSKYVQSKLERDVIHKLKEILDTGRFVCFSGTPCQTEGFKRYIRKEYSNLVLVDVVCRAVASPKIFRKYIEYQQDRFLKEINNVRFRDKYFGYDWSTISLETNGKMINYHRGIESDQYLRAFFQGICNRPSCYECRFRSPNRISDFTLWDCLRVWNYSKELDNNKGATRMIVHSEIANQIFIDICNRFKFCELSIYDATKNTKEFFCSPMINTNRARFFNDAEKMKGEELFNKWFANTIKTNISYYIRVIIYKIGLYPFLKKLYVRIKKSDV